jgi:hypothetical protein
VAAPNYDSFNIPQNNTAEARAVISAILRAEEQKGSLLDSQSQSDAEAALKILERDNRNAFDTIMASQGDDKALVRMDVFLPMMAAINSAKRTAARADNRPDGDYVGLGMSGGRLRSHQNMRGRSGRELDFVPAKALNSAAPPVSMGYGSQHRPKFAWEQEEERAGGRYVRQDRVPYNLHGGLGMVNPDAEIGAYQVLRRAGEVGRGMSGGVYLPKEYIVQPAGEKEFFGYGVDGDNDVFGMEGGYGSLKRRLAGGMVNPFANDRDYHYKPKETGYDDAMDFAYGNHEEPLEGAQQAHEEEEEKPVDLDENPNPFRVRNENYKVNTGKMKKVYGGTFRLSREDYQVAQFHYYLVFVRDVYLPILLNEPKAKPSRYLERGKEVFGKLKRKTTEKRQIPFTNADMTYDSASRLVRRYRQMAGKLLRNVSSGEFPGDYEETFIKNQSQIRAEKAAKAHQIAPKKRLRGRPVSMDQTLLKRESGFNIYEGLKRKTRSDKGVKRGKQSSE